MRNKDFVNAIRTLPPASAHDSYTKSRRRRFGVSLTFYRTTFYTLGCYERKTRDAGQPRSSSGAHSGRCPLDAREVRDGLNHTKELPMIAMRRPYARSIHALIIIALMVVPLGHVLAQSSTVDVPANASAKHYGSGWVCDRGYRKVNGTCAGQWYVRSRPSARQRIPHTYVLYVLRAGLGVRTGLSGSRRGLRRLQRTSEC
jgi:hypothetical protein